MPKTTALVSKSVVALAASALCLTACEDKKAPAPSPPAPIPVIAAPAMPSRPPLLDRVTLLQAMDAASSAYAAGEAFDAKDLVGRRFTVRQAFGCEGASPPHADDAPGDGVGRWSWDDDRKTIRIALAPGDWLGSPLITGGSQSWEAVEGFWLDRPWLRQADCPGVAPDPLASGPGGGSAQVAGIAAVFEAQGSRLGRRNGREYAHVSRGEGGAPATAPANGYRLILEGRLAAFDDGSPIRCRAAGPRQRPVCVAAAAVDRVAFEDAQGVLLSEWRVG